MKLKKYILINVVVGTFKSVSSQMCLGSHSPKIEVTFMIVNGIASMMMIVVIAFSIRSIQYHFQNKFYHTLDITNNLESNSRSCLMYIAMNIAAMCVGYIVVKTSDMTTAC